jgi:hypothetical protein
MRLLLLSSSNVHGFLADIGRRVRDDRVTLMGGRQARIFRRGEAPFEVDPGTRIDQMAR